MSPQPNDPLEQMAAGVPDLDALVRQRRMARQAEQMIAQIQERIAALPPAKRAWVEKQLGRPTGDALRELVHQHTPAQEELLQAHPDDFYGRIAPAMMDLGQLLLLTIVNRNAAAYPNIATIIGQMVERTYALGFRRGFLQHALPTVGPDLIAAIVSDLAEEVEHGDQPDAPTGTDVPGPGGPAPTA